MLISDIASTQALTFAIPLGVLCLGLLWGFFQRRPVK